MPEEDRTPNAIVGIRFPIEAAVLLPQRRVVALVVAEESLHINPFINDNKRERRHAETPLTLAVLAPNGAIMVGSGNSTMVGLKSHVAVFVTRTEPLQFAPFVNGNERELRCSKFPGKVPHIS